MNRASNERFIGSEGTADGEITRSTFLQEGMSQPECRRRITRNIQKLQYVRRCISILENLG